MSKKIEKTDPLQAFQKEFDELCTKHNVVVYPLPFIDQQGTIKAQVHLLDKNDVKQEETK